MWEIREPIYNEIVKEIKNNFKQDEFVGTRYWNGVINGGGWTFVGAIIILSDRDILPVWWEFSLNSKQPDDFSFEKLKKIYSELNID